MSGDGQGQGGKEPVERVLDVFVHTPIGLALMAWKRVPELVTAVPGLVGQAVAKGCASLAGAEERISDEVRRARMIGQVAVTFGGRQLRKEVDARLRDARQAAGGMTNFIPGMGIPGESNGSAGVSGSGERGAPWVTATETPTTPASAPEAAATPDTGRRAPAKPTRARKAPAKTPAKAPAKTPAKTAAKRPAKTPTKAPAKRGARSSAAASAGASASAPAVAELPIPQYDGLSASQVVARLAGLSAEELRAVRSYEEGSRGRRTVLVAIDRLLT